MTYIITDRISSLIFFVIISVGWFACVTILNNAANAGDHAAFQLAPTPVFDDSPAIATVAHAIHPAPVLAAVYSPDGSKILTGCEDRIARLWSIQEDPVINMVETQRYEAQAGAVTAVAFSASGLKVLTGHEDGTAGLWDAQSGMLLQRYPQAETPMDAPVSAVAISEDESRVAVGTRSDLAVVFDAASAEEIFPYYHPLNEMVHAVLFNGDGDLITGTEKHVILWRIESDDIRVLETPGLSVQLSPDEAVLITAGGEIRFWDAYRFTLLRAMTGQGDWENPEARWAPKPFLSHTRLAAAAPDLMQIISVHEQNILALWYPTIGKRVYYNYDYSPIHAIDHNPQSAEGHFIVAAGNHLILMELRSNFISMNPIPTPTPPPVSNMLRSRFNIVHLPFMERPYLFTVQPRSGDIYWIGGGNIYKMTVLDDQGNFLSPQLYTAIPAEAYSEYSNINFLEAGEDGTLYIADNSNIEFIYSIAPRVKRKHLLTERKQYSPSIHGIVVLTSKENIADAAPGDVFVLLRDGMFFSVYKIDPSLPNQQADLYLSSEQLPNSIRSMFIGPEGKLCFVAGTVDAKIYRLEEDKSIREITHYTLLSLFPWKTVYLPGDDSFYTISKWGNMNSLSRINRDGSQYEPFILDGSQTIGDEIEVSPDGKWIYYLRNDLQRIVGLRLKSSINAPTATPTPQSPASTPTPLPGWYVVDGFGGIHTSKPELKKPVLPYFIDVNIVRDIEPDPLGRGWYMLDGFGGIHTDPYDLPKPESLPYFGFDIARNLEVREQDGQVYFYLLDGFGIVHSTDPQFSTKELKIFYEDTARELEPEPNGNGWIVMDSVGNLHFSHRKLIDQPLMGSSLYSARPRSFVRFADHHTVVIDSAGGRHTNIHYPAKDVVDGLPEDFYFYSFDIIWDLELVPEFMLE